MANMTIELSEYVIDAIADAVVKKMQEPCEDAISRQAVLDALDKSKYSDEFCEEHHIDWSINLGMAHIVVNELKPVTPQQKTDILDKIRAEIDQMSSELTTDGRRMIRRESVFQIINKYKAESEDVK